MMIQRTFFPLLFLLLVEISISFSIPAETNRINVDRPTPAGGASRVGYIPDSPEEGFKDSLADMEDYNGYVSDPSAEAAVFKHIDDMTFIEIPHVNSTSSESVGRTRRNAIRYRGGLWPNGRVPYFISSSYSASQRQVILRAMRHWEDNTCIRFHPRTTERYYIFIMSGSGCHSFVGRVRSYYQPQGISLGRGCVFFSTAVHELGHAIGFFHEHTRHDRDEYIEVISNNIRDGAESNFHKFEEGQTDTLGYGYDYASVMHYSRTSFAKSFDLGSIRAKDPNIVFGQAQELSPLDILKSNRLYGCVPGRHPPISTLLPDDKPLALPEGITCGRVLEAKTGTFQSPGYPKHLNNQECAWVIRIPDGYYFRIDYPDLQLEESEGCSRDFVQVFRGDSLDTDNAVYINSRARDGKICNRRQMYYRPINVYWTDTITIYYHTDGSNTGSSARGLKVQFSSVDLNECSTASKCHSCRNLPGSYECDCNDGYYHSPAANTCYDVNECAYANGGCAHKCVNSGGSYSCECDDGFYLQTDGLSCSKTPIVPTLPTTRPTTRPTTPPTTRPTSPPPTPVPCGGQLKIPSGVIQTPNWPETYPLNFDCEWIIQLPDSNSDIELTFEGAFGIAGNYVDNCPKDYLRVYDGLENGATSFGLICDLTRPAPIRTTSNKARLVFHAGPYHGPKRLGFRIVYRSVSRPTIPPPTTLPTTRPTTPPTTRPTTRPTSPPPTPVPCGGQLKIPSGVIQTPNWPETYPLNFDCEWIIQLPDSNSDIELTFEGAFGIAGNYVDNCSKDYLKVYDGLENGATSFGLICDLTRPAPIRTTSNEARLVFHAGPYHGPLRKGFRIRFTSIGNVITVPPTTIPPTPNCPNLPTNPQGQFQCGGFINPNHNENFGPGNLLTGPITTPLDCHWKTLGSRGARFRVKFMYFDIPSSNGCTKNHVSVYDGFTASSPLLDKVCGVKCDDYVVQGTSSIMYVRLVINSPGSFRGFHAQFEPL